MINSKFKDHLISHKVKNGVIGATWNDETKTFEKKKQILNIAKDKVINDLLNKYKKPTLETDEEKVIRILKKDFEAKHGMTFDKFVEVYQKILSESPEKLI